MRAEKDPTMEQEYTRELGDDRSNGIPDTGGHGVGTEIISSTRSSSIHGPRVLREAST